MVNTHNLASLGSSFYMGAERCDEGQHVGGQQRFFAFAFAVVSQKCMYYSVCI